MRPPASITLVGAITMVAVLAWAGAFASRKLVVDVPKLVMVNWRATGKTPARITPNEIVLGVLVTVVATAFAAESSPPPSQRTSAVLPHHRLWYSMRC